MSHDGAELDELLLEWEERRDRGEILLKVEAQI